LTQLENPSLRLGPAAVCEGFAGNLPLARDACQEEVVDEGDSAPEAIFGNGGERDIAMLTNRYDPAR
jgi:hypothetical protein